MHPNWISVANDAETLNDFIAYTILSESLHNLTTPEEIFFKEKYVYLGSSSFRYERGNHQIIMLSKRSCSFISCYGIQHEMSYELFVKPFQKTTWIALGFSIFAFAGMIRFSKWHNVKDEISAPSNLDIILISLSILLEISLPSRVISEVIPGKLSPIFWLWVISSVAITGMYKDCFTADIIQPYTRTPSWSNVYDLEGLGFRFLLPLKRFQEFDQLFSNGIPVDSILATEFAAELSKAASYKGKSKRQLGYRRVAKHLMEGNNGSIWQGLHYKWPFDLYTNLSRCSQKFAYVDYTENIVDILPFLNDNDDGIVFLKGADDGFLATHFGFRVDSTHRKNFVYGRLKGLISSGIYHWWEKWFKKTRPKKIFPYYANWTKPVLSELDRRDFRTKFVTICQIWGYCCIACSFVYIFEIVQSFIQNM
ncbi:hypothetical protein Fcan01_15890 [Folsomia candida]|uniref:Uncharacterized protein n=1 Tax=Folsomia candida TaxID=158441 RepID=A0A226DXY7_FOLCA|nr:hypothetical protein Fcan01_15890 [Folsomia candida]